MLPEGTVDHAGLAEAAAADAAAHQFDAGPVLGHLDKGDQRGIDVAHIVHVPHHLTLHLLRDSFAYRAEGCQRPVRIVFGTVKLRDVDPRHRGRGLQEFLPAFSRRLIFFIEVDQTVIDHLSLSDVKHVEEGGNGLGIIGAGTAADDQRVRLRPVLRPERDPGKLQDLEDVGVAHFILDGDSQEIAFPDRPLGLQREQRDLPLPHDAVQVGPGREHPLAVHVLPPVEHTVQDLHAEMAHADLVHVRKTHGKTDSHAVRVLDDGIDLAADIAGGLLNGKQQPVVQCKFLHDRFTYLSEISGWRVPE